MLNLKKLSVQASDEEDEPGKIAQEYIGLWYVKVICAVISQRACLLFPQSSPLKKETRKRYVISLQWHFVHDIVSLHLFTCWFGVHQGGNIFAALSQGQSDDDEDEDLDEQEDKPAKKVQCKHKTYHTFDKNQG